MWGKINMDSKVSRLLLPFLLLASLCACSRYIEGGVYLDKNGNNIKDFGEPNISGIQYSVTGDGSTVNSGVTDPDGKFLVQLESAKLDVNYCVSVDSAGGLVFPANSPSGKALEASTSSDEDNSDSNAECKKLNNGQPDCSDDDCCDFSQCQGATACEKEETPAPTTDPDACPKGSDDKPQCSDSRCSDEPACVTLTVKSMQACDKTKSTELTMQLDVPVAMDYSSRISKIEKTTHVAQVGEIIGLEIVYPKSCSFQPFILPKTLQVSLGGAYDAVTREVFLVKAIAERPSQLFYNDTPRFGHDELITYLLPVEVIGGGSSGDEELQLQPKLSCPDGKEVLSNLQVIRIKSGSSSPGSSEAYELTSEITGECPELGESGVLLNSIEHTGGEGMAASSYALTISGGANYVTLEDLPEYCQQVGPTVECDLEASNSLTKLGISFNFKISESLPKPSTISFSSKLEVNGATFNDAPVSCTYE